jgi:hypothetical protein
MAARDARFTRLTHHAFHNLVHTHESALAKATGRSISMQGHPGRFLLFASNDLFQIVEFSIRIDVAAKLAAMMAERIVNKVTFRHTPVSDIFDIAEKFGFLSDEDSFALGRVFELDQ